MSTMSGGLRVAAQCIEDREGPLHGDGARWRIERRGVARHHEPVLDAWKDVQLDVGHARSRGSVGIQHWRRCLVVLALDKHGVKPAGESMTIYTETDDRGFEYHAAVPIDAIPADPPKGDIAIGEAPSGKALKFVHRGSYDALDSTYEAITNDLDKRQLDAKDQFIEEYVSDILSTPPDDLVVNIYVPVK